MVSDNNLKPLGLEELARLEADELITSAKGQQYNLLIDVLEYSKAQYEQTTDNFFNFYFQKHHSRYADKELKLKDNDKKNIRVNRTRLNNILMHYNYSVNSEFHFCHIKLSMEMIEQEVAKDFLALDIQEIRIFDSYEEDDTSKVNLFKVIKDTLNGMIQSKKSVQIISTFHSEYSQDFYRGLLKEQDKIDSDSKVKPLQIYYIDECKNNPASLLYMLISDVRGKEFFIYYDSLSSCYLLSPVEKKRHFVMKFYQSLVDRFNYCIEKEDNRILVKEKYFKTEFNFKINKIINELQYLLDLKNYNENEIPSKIWKVKKKLQIAKLHYYKIKNVYSILEHQIKLVEILLLLKLNGDNKLIHTKVTETKAVLFKLFNLGIPARINIDLEQEIATDSYLFSDENFEDFESDKFKRALYFQQNFNEISLIELFPNLLWNTSGQIVDSFNQIILSEKNACTFISKLFSKGLKGEIYEKDIVHHRFIVRSILDSLYNIKFEPDNINFTEDEMKEMKKLRFSPRKIHENIERLLSIL